MKDIIIIRGASGVGKSSLAEMLGANLSNGVTIEVDTIHDMINSVTWEDRHEHLNSLIVACNVAKNYLILGYSPVVIVDTLSDDKLTQFVCELHGFKYFIISLYAEQKILFNRIETRGGAYINYNASKLVNDMIFRNRHLDECLIDTSYMNIGQVFDCAWHHIKR